MYGYGPVGDRKALGLRGRVGISHRRLWKRFFPEVILSASLSRTSMTGASSSGLSAEMGLGAMIGMRID